ncbi:MAG: SGNH/GDSL hydrolase family protein [Cellvibrio sp.]
MSRTALSHNEAVDEVYRLTPQIREYDEFMYLGVRWLPYTMFFHHKNYVSRVINTDDLGFRISEANGKRFSTASFDNSRPVNLLVGGSTVLGTGATADCHTTSSRLAARTGDTWLNFSGRGYNAIQEYMLFLMHQKKFNEIKNVVIFSGINTLSLEGFPDHLANEHGRYYYSYEFDHYMGKYNDDLRRRKNTYASALQGRNQSVVKKTKSIITNLFTEEENPADIVLSDEGIDTTVRLHRAAEVISDAIDVWKVLLAPFNAKLTFVLQPMSYWSKDSFTSDELEIFHAIDSCPNNFWRMFNKILHKDVHAPFSDHIRQRCKKNDVAFYDMNVMLKDSEILNEYLFVDHVHFNDKGYDEAARLITTII